MAGRQELEAKIVKKAWEDAAFKQALVSDPRKAIEEALGASLPAGIGVQVIEESKDKMCLVIPVKPDDMALSDAELEAVAGGASSWGAHCSSGKC